MENIIFEIASNEKDKHGQPFVIHVTQEVNGYIVWVSEYDEDGRYFVPDRVFQKGYRNPSIIYAVEKAKGVIL